MNEQEGMDSGFVRREDAPGSTRKRRARRKRVAPGEVRQKVLETLRSEGFGKEPEQVTQGQANLSSPEAKPFEKRAPADRNVDRNARAPLGKEAEPIQARMLNEFVYCPRLFYYEYVEGVFVENADTLRGSAIHQRVDSGSGAMPAAAGRNEKCPGTNVQKNQSGGAAGGGMEASGGTPDTARGTPAPLMEEVIHSRSVSMGSDRLGVVAKMDLVEVRAAKTAEDSSNREEADLFERLEVCPVDYKAGAPRDSEKDRPTAEADGLQIWDTDKMQLGLQGLILRDNGYACKEGIIYYRATRQRVRLPITPELEGWILSKIAEARQTITGPIPPPLVSSPKCMRCSLAPVCLPDETRLLAKHVGDEVTRLTLPENPGDEHRVEQSLLTSPPTGDRSEAPRRLIASRDDTRPLYLNTPGVRVGCSGEVLQVKEKEKVLQEVRLRDVSHVALFGNIQISTQAVQALCELEVPVTYFSMGGWFYGITRGHGLKNVFLRMEQFRQARDEMVCLSLARQFVHGKIRNHRTILMRNHLEPPPATILRLKRAADDALEAKSLEELLGIEGAAASEYFREFSGMIKVADELSGAVEEKEQLAFNFNFSNRNRRPPGDPVNAMLSLAYSMLSKDCTLAALAVGFDPYVGFYHQPRFGRPALGLDLMEEFRPLVAESTVLNCINSRIITGKDFVKAGQAVNLSAGGRKRFFQAYEQRMSALITHPLFEYKVSYRRALELQARLLGKTVTGEISGYVPLLTR